MVANPAEPDEPAGATFNATEAQYEEAVEAAVAAFEVTRTLPAYERGAILRNISAGIKARREELGRLIAPRGRQADPRRARSRSTGRRSRSASARRRRSGCYGETIPLDLMAVVAGRVGITRRFPIGPIAGISPFNFPLNLAAHKVAPAIASGNPIVLKPPSKDPLTMLTVAEIIEEAGAPAGSVSILPMTRELGDRMVADERFKLLTFTGSPSVGWRMKERAGKKKVVLELGGNAGVIVDKTADLDWAVRRTLVGAFTLRRPGLHQRPADVRPRGRLGHVHGPVRRGRAGAQGRRPARPADRRRARWSTRAAASRTQRWVDEARRAGRQGAARRQGRRHVLPADDPDRRPGDGARSARTRRSRRSSSRSRSATSDDAIRAGERLVLRPPDRRLHERPRARVAAFHELEVGGVIVNDVPTYRIDHMPYGGVKDSGLGREGLRWAIEDMTEIRIMVLAQPQLDGPIAASPPARRLTEPADRGARRAPGPVILGRWT